MTTMEQELAVHKYDQLVDPLAYLAGCQLCIPKSPYNFTPMLHCIDLLLQCYTIKIP